MATTILPARPTYSPFQLLLQLVSQLQLLCQLIARPHTISVPICPIEQLSQWRGLLVCSFFFARLRDPGFASSLERIAAARSSIGSGITSTGASPPSVVAYEVTTSRRRLKTPRPIKPMPTSKIKEGSGIDVSGPGVAVAVAEYVVVRDPLLKKLASTVWNG
jgi:hypothetical protein